MSLCFEFAHRSSIRTWILGALLAVSATTAVAAEPAKLPPEKKHVAVAKHVGAAPTRPSLALSDAPPVFFTSEQPKYQRPPDQYLAAPPLKPSVGASPGPGNETDARASAPTGPLNQAAQLDSYGLLPSPLHAQVPPLVTIGEWNFSAAAHVPVTRGRDTGAAISVQHEF